MSAACCSGWQGRGVALQPATDGAEAAEAVTGDPEGAAEATDGIDLAVASPADHQTDMLERAGAERCEHAPKLALAGLAGAAEQLEVLQAGEVTGELADIAAEHGDPRRAAHHAYFPPRATRRVREKRIWRRAWATPTSWIGAL